MKKFNLLLLDSSVVIHLFRLGIWENVIKQCDIHLAETVVDEARFYLDDEGLRHDFDLPSYATSGAISVFHVMPSDLDVFRTQFDRTYLERLHAGETESLAYLLVQPARKCVICSADKIVYRVLGAIRLSDRGISLEEVLQGVGLGRALPHYFGKSYRERWTTRGFQNGIQGIGAKKTRNP